ncbi:MAG: tRNA pseudouridine(55) synthase TruB [Porphyromonas sp.]|nr:tRNA pseudouridine(55) synthase TruB [Porphyromonas sp.]
MYVVVDKPLRWTSFDVVNRVRILLSKKLGIRRIKVGHAGTLDPLATGVLVLCTGRFTKRIEEIQKLHKTYVATIQLGATTPSYDLESEVDCHYPTDHITQAAVEQVLEGFVGMIDQVPPTFSAVKVDGVRSYSLARGGCEVELQPRKVEIKSIQLLRYELPEIEIEVECGKGTYIRALARDIGRALDTGAHLTALRRTQVGHFSERQAMSVDALEGYVDEVLNQDIIEQEI